MSAVEFSTTDIVLAAALKSIGYQVKAILKNGNIGTFVFDNVSDEIIDDYDFGRMLVEPVSLNQNIKTLTTAVRRY
jgi:hypothetical protein